MKRKILVHQFQDADRPTWGRCEVVGVIERDVCLTRALVVEQQLACSPVVSRKTIAHASIAGANRVLATLPACRCKNYGCAYYPYEVWLPYGTKTPKLQPVEWFAPGEKEAS